MDDCTRRNLLVANRESLRRFVRTLSWSDDEAEELLQDVAVVVLAHRVGPPDRATFFAWCCGVARHVAAHRRRTHARRSTPCDPLSEEAIDAALASTTDDDVEHVAIARDELTALIDRLDGTSKALLHDRFVNEETAAEIAVRLNISPASVRMRIARVLSDLRRRAPSSSTKPGAAKARAVPRSGAWPVQRRRDDAPESDRGTAEEPVAPPRRRWPFGRSG